MAGKQGMIAVFFAIFCILKESNAAITPLDETYIATLDNDFSIPWTYDNETDMKTVDWTYKSSSSATPTTIMSKVGTAAATVFNDYNVEHVGNGNITLKKVTMDNAGIYFCTADYKLSSGLSVVTGTATISVTASTVIDVPYNCTGMKDIDTKEGCICIWTFVGILLLVAVDIISFMVVGVRLYYCKESCCCDVGDELPSWMQKWWQKVIFVGILIVYCCKRCTGNGDVKPKEEKPRHETRSGNTHTGQKKPETKKNESKDSGAHIENEQHNQGKKHREQPLPPSGAGAATGTAMHGREDSDGAVSREHVDLQESGRTLKRRPMPDISRKSDGQGHDSKGRGLSANLSDDDQPLIGIDIPSKRAGALGSLPEGTGGEGPVKKLKKKKRKSKEDQEDEV